MVGLTTDQRQLLLWFYTEIEELHDLWQSPSAKPLYVLLCLCQHVQETDTIPPGFTEDLLQDVLADTLEDWDRVSQQDREVGIADFLANGPHTWRCNPAHPSFDKIHKLYRQTSGPRSL